MNQVNAKYLAPLIPVGPSEVIFQYEINLDGSFEQQQISGAKKIDINNVPFQFSVPTYKNNKEKWSIGFNVFKEGDVTKYQPFFWLGDPPNSGRITNVKKFQRYGDVKDVNSSDETSVNIPVYPWLNCTVKTLKTNFSLEIIKGDIKAKDATETPQIAKKTEFHNDQDKEIVYTPTVEYTYEQTAETSITDTHSFSAGLSLNWEGEVGWFVTGSKFSVGLNLEYTYSHTTTATSTATEDYKIEETLNITVNPKETVYLNLILYSCENAKADVSLDFKLSGSINGKALKGDYLKALVNEMSATDIKEINDQDIVYTVKGETTAAVVSKSEIKVSPKPLQVRQGEVVPA